MPVRRYALASMANPESANNFDESRIRLPRAWDFRHYTFWHLTQGGETILALRDRRNDTGVLISGGLLMLTPLVIPFGLDVEFFLFFASMVLVLFTICVLSTQRRLYVSIVSNELEIRSGFFATPRSRPLRYIPNPRLVVRPVHVTASKWGFGGVRGFGCLLLPVGSRCAMLAFAASREDIHRHIRGSPVLCRLDVINEDEELVMFSRPLYNE